MTWTLVIFIHASVMSSGDSVALTNITGFATEQACQAAAEKSRPLVSATFKAIKTVCLPVGKS